MHPCREYWGQDVAYGSLVTGERLRRADHPGALTEIWILDTLGATRAAPHAELTGLMRRIGGLQGADQSLRQSAAHLKDFLQAGQSAPPSPAGAPRLHRCETLDEEQRILGIATLHRTAMLPAGSFAAAAGVPSKAAREESSALLCAAFMRHLGELGAGAGVSQIDWVMVRASDTADVARSHLGATRVTHLELTPFAPDAKAPSPTATASSEAGPPAA
jgi:hypothetical protein